MTIADFRRLALALPDATESSHMGSPDFRVDDRIFATLAAQDQGYGNLMISPEQQADFLADAPELFLPIKGGWGRMGMTHIRLEVATELTLAAALRTAYTLRCSKNAKPASRKPAGSQSARRRSPRNVAQRADPAK